MTFYFYDLETSGFNPKEARVMQFGGQRTDMNLRPVGESHTFYIKLSSDVLPDPDAILVTGITPQRTLSDGLTEAEFLKIFQSKIATPNTIFAGFNNIRFDDEFMRYLHYRNFYDPYEWQWQEGKSRWDLLDVSRMTRALRPEGIKWPFDSDGKPGNRLEMLASVNNIAHQNAHDALGDVKATLAIAQLIRQKQPKLFDYLLTMRDKKDIAKLVNSGQPFVYTSGKYSSEFEKTTVVAALAQHPKRQGVLVYDLRYDPEPFIKMSVNDLVEVWKWQEDPEALRLPIKTLQFNRVPAVAPLSVLDEKSKGRLKIDLKDVNQNLQKVNNTKFINNVLKALAILDTEQQAQFFSSEQLVDGQLYEGFYADEDRKVLRQIRAVAPSELNDLADVFKDERLKALLPLYKARNFPKFLTRAEQEIWRQYKKIKLIGGGQTSRMTRFRNRIKEIESRNKLNQKQEFILKELQDYVKSLEL